MTGYDSASLVCSLTGMLKELFWYYKGLLLISNDEKIVRINVCELKIVRKNCEVTWTCSLFLSGDIPVSSRFFILQVPQAV